MTPRPPILPRTGARAIAAAALLAAFAHAPAGHAAALDAASPVAAAASSGPAASAPDAPPRAVPGDLVTDYPGLKIADPYRALEDLKSPATQAWAEGNAAFTRRQLDALPGLPALRARIAALADDPVPRIQSVQVTRGGRWFYLKRGPSEAAFSLWVRDRVDGPERLLLDPHAWTKASGHHQAINNYSVSPDGRHVAAVVSVDDAELGELRLYDVATGRAVREPVPAIWGELAAAWTRDSQAVYYAQGAEAGQPGGEPFGHMRVFERRLAGGDDRPVIGVGMPWGVEVRDKDWVSLDAASSPTWTLAQRSEGVHSSVRIAVARSDSLRKDPQHAAWLSMFDAKAGIEGVGIADHWLYARTFAEAPRYRVLRYDLTHPDQAPVTVVPQQAGVIDAITAAADALYFLVRSGATTELWRLPHGAKPEAAQRVALPFVGASTLFDANPEVPGVVYEHEGWAHPSVLMRTRGTASVVAPLVPASTSTLGADWVAEQLACTSYDGVLVPMSVLYRRGLVKDGSHPTYMQGYGGYGIPEPAWFDRKREAWLERGGIWVDVDPRGGGAFGREWYQAGVGARKANTWKDMVACGQALVERGYTSRAKLAIEGTSMGGVAVGGALTERPDLFAVAIVRVGITDTVRFVEASPNGPNHEIEMGSPKTEDGIRQLQAMSTYARLRDGEKYPAMLFTAGMNDNRVAPWITYKTFARAAAATSSGRPVLLRVETEGGHGVTQTVDQRVAELADRWAFILWNTGDPAFQPPKAP
jgi:prolyl oligopeptidase